MAIGSWPHRVVTAMRRVTRQTGRVTEEEDASPATAVDANPEAVLGKSWALAVSQLELPAAATASATG